MGACPCDTGPLLFDFGDRRLKSRHRAGEFTKASEYRTVVRNEGFGVSHTVLGSSIGPVVQQCMSLQRYIVSLCPSLSSVKW